MTLGSTAQPPTAIISTRRGIAWGLSAPDEDSSVLVLTSPERYYIDIRFALEGPATSGPFWAFAGQVTYAALSATTDSGLAPNLSGWGQVGLRGEWNHPIDSMGNTSGVDRADLFDLANGDQIEVGLLENPDTGKEDRFMEYWTKPDGYRAEDVSSYTVAKLHGDKGELEGLAIRIGGFAQGMRTVMEDGRVGVKVARWSRGEGTWSRDERSDATEQDIPMAWLVGNREMGDRLEGWSVSECQ